MRGQRATAHDRNGRVLTRGRRIRVLGDPVQEGEIRRIVPRYGVVTVIVDQKAGKAERMVRVADVELLEPGR